MTCDPKVTSASGLSFSSAKGALIWCRAPTEVSPFSPIFRSGSQDAEKQVDVSVVTWLATRISNSSSNLRSPNPWPPKVPASRFPSGESLGLTYLPGTLVSGGWCLPGGWSSSSRRHPSALIPLQMVTSLCALPGPGVQILPGPSPFPRAKGEAVRLQAMAARPLAGLEPRAGNDPVSIWRQLTVSPHAPVCSPSSHSGRLCNGERVMQGWSRPWWDWGNRAASPAPSKSLWSRARLLLPPLSCPVGTESFSQDWGRNGAGKAVVWNETALPGHQES